MTEKVKAVVIPYDDRIIVKRDPTPEKVGSIIVPDTVKEEMQPYKGTIIAVGNTVHDNPDGTSNPHNKMITPGQRIVFGKYAGSDMKEVIGQDYMVMRTNDILGFITQEEENSTLNTNTEK